MVYMPNFRPQPFFPKKLTLGPSIVCALPCVVVKVPADDFCLQPDNRVRCVVAVYFLFGAGLLSVLILRLEPPCALGFFVFSPFHRVRGFLKLVSSPQAPPEVGVFSLFPTLGRGDPFSIFLVVPIFSTC